MRDNRPATKLTDVDEDSRQQLPDGVHDSRLRKPTTTMIRGVRVIGHISHGGSNTRRQQQPTSGKTMHESRQHRFNTQDPR